MSDREKLLRLALRGTRLDAEMLAEPDPTLGVNLAGECGCDCEACRSGECPGGATRRDESSDAESARDRFVERMNNLWRRR